MSNTRLGATSAEDVVAAARRAGLVLTLQRAAAALPLVQAMERADEALASMALTEAPLTPDLSA